MFKIAQALQFDAGADLPAAARGFWFPDLIPCSRRCIEVLVWIAKTSQRGGHSGSLYRIDRGSTIDLVWLAPTSSESLTCDDQRLDRLATPLVDWSESGAECQLWIPYNSGIVPPVPPEDRSSILPSAAVLIWLPLDGLIHLENRHRCSVLDFFQSPAASESVWQRAPDVEVRFPVIRDLQPSIPIEINELLADGNDWIGQDSNQFDEVSSDDSVGKVETAKRWLLKKLDDWSTNEKEKGNDASQDRSVAKPPSKIGRPASAAGGMIAGGAGWMGAIGQSIAERLAKRLEAERKRQVEKLLSMLKTDPDRALRFALPIGGNRGFRGFAMPGSKLLERLPDFSLGGIRGGGPVDNWSLSDELQNRLRQSYYDQISRAKAAGLYRQAAYIAAHLLSDFQLAATTLEDGGHFSEAAEVYTTKLNRPKDGARCLAQSGQWEKAVKLYWEFGEIETAGDVLRDAGQPSEAIEAYEEASLRYRSNGRVFEAVKVLDEKLDRRDAALDLLWDQWPTGNEAYKSCERAMEMLSSDGRHDEVKSRMRWIKETGGVKSTFAAAMIFRGVAKSTPDEEVRTEASDACRIAAVRGFEMASPMEVDQRMDLIGELDDPFGLLRRDSTTFANRFREEKRLRNRPPQRLESRSQNAVHLLRDKSTTTRFDSVTYADVSGETIRVLGTRGGGTLLGCFSGALQGVSTTKVDGLDLSLYTPDEFQRLGSGSDPILLRGGRGDGASSLPPPILDLEDAGFGCVQRYATSRGGVISGLRHNKEWMLVQGKFDEHSPTRVIPDSFIDLNLFLVEGLPDPWAFLGPMSDAHLFSIDQHLFLSCDRRVALLSPGKPLWWDDLRRPILRFTTSHPSTRKRLVVIDCEGLVVYWLEGPRFRKEVVAEGDFSQICLLRNGFLAVAGDDAIHLYELGRQGYRKRCSEKRVHRAPIISMMTWKQDGFLIAHQDGEIELWKVQKRT